MSFLNLGLANHRIVFGSRIIEGGGTVKHIGPKPMRRTAPALGKVRWQAPTASAVIFIGQAKGHEPQNRAGRCKARPETATAESVDLWFRKLRAAQVGDASVAATRVAARGWYKGRP